MKLFLVALMVAVAFGCTKEITSFDECVGAGNPVMESYPRQCSSGGQTFVEEVAKLNQCQAARPEFCTMEYNPVCALKDNNIRCITTPCASFDAVTTSNACAACSDAAVLGYYSGSCVDGRFAVCSDNKMTPGLICVDICPHNYDSYLAQTGVQMCIEHYGEAEIKSWETCTRSSQSCNCVKAYETTAGEKIYPEFRCAPEQYAERLLFTGGRERLDEEGHLTAVIA